MSAAALGAGARPLPALPDGADSSAALTACASSAGGALALLALLALASAAPDIISAAPAQMRAAVANRPMDMPGLPLRRLRSAQVRFLAPGPADPSTSSSIAMVSSWFCGRGSARGRAKTGVCVAARLAQRREHRDGDQNDADRAGGARVPVGAVRPAGSAGSG